MRLRAAAAVLALLVASACQSAGPAPLPAAGETPSTPGAPSPSQSLPSRDSTASPAQTAVPVTATLVAAGDIAACEADGDEATAALLDTIEGTVGTLGDSVYPSGTPEQFAACYAPSWGRHLARTRPALGNHDYDTPGAAGYFGYFGAAAGDPATGWYSYDLGAWHVVVLNSNCDHVGGCGAGSPQERWLRDDLAANPARCTLAYWHHPLFTSGPHGPSRQVLDLWLALDDAGAELVLGGHDHHYERFASQDPDGVMDPDGIRQFVVGTGSRNLRPVTAVAPNSEARTAAHSGVLELTLNENGYEWQFVAVGDGIEDAGAGECH